MSGLFKVLQPLVALAATIPGPHQPFALIATLGLQIVPSTLRAKPREWTP